MTLSLRRAAIVFALLALPACGPTMTVHWEPLPSLKAPPASRYPKMPAVILKREVHIDTFVGRRERHEDLQVHEVRALLLPAAVNPGDDDYSTVKIPIRPDERLAVFQARTVSPDGQVQEVDASQVFVAKNRAGALLTNRTAVEYRLFHFPNAQVGSVLEFIYALTAHDINLTHLRHVDDEVPIEKYVARLTFNDRLRAEANVYNTSALFFQHTGFSETTFTLEMGPLQAVEPDATALPWNERRIWWGSRIKGFDAVTTYYNMGGDWPAVFENRAHSIYTSDGYSKGAGKLRLDDGVVAACAGARRCLIDRALEATRDRAELSSFSTDGPRNLTEVAASGSATNHEKALLLRHLLDKAGVEANVAYTSRGSPHGFERIAPNIRAYDHTVVYVPSQTGIETALWLDPSCEECAAGDLPSWDADSQALVVAGKDRRFGAFAVQTRLAPIAGRVRRESDQRTRYTVTLDPTGDATVEETVKSTGAIALARRFELRKLDEKQKRAAGERHVVERLAGGRLVDHQERCDRAAGSCSATFHYTLPGYAAVDGDRLVVPLTVFAPSDAKKPAARRTGLLVRGDPTVEEIAEIRLPPGYHVAEMAPRAEKGSASSTVLFEARSDGETIVARRIFATRAGRYPLQEQTGLWEAQVAFDGFRRGLFILSR